MVRILGSTGTRRRRRYQLAALFSVAAVLALIAVPASAVLPGSTFEGNDGNLVVDTAGNTDWANAPNRVVGLDQPSGSTDNSFGQGTKEDNANATVVTGSIPPNKNDLTRFYVGSEFVSGSNFLYLAWERAVNIGNANLDLELSQNATAGFTGTTTGPVTLNRTAGDILITYDFSGSGTPTLGLLKWVTSGPTSQCFSSNSLPCWGNRVNLSAAGSAEGAVNTGTVTDPVPPNAPRTLTTGLFGEAAVNLTAAGVFPAGTCEAFGSTFLKSRASSSFGAEVKDFIAPQPVNISNCGEIKIIKHTNPRGVNQTFSYTSTIPNPPSGSTTPSCTSDTTPSAFTLNDSGNSSSDNAANTEDCTKVVAGSYTVTEGAEPANFTLESLLCTATGGGSGAQDGTDPLKANITVVPNSVVTCTYTNKQNLGALKIIKTSSKGTNPGLAGAQFSITGPNSYSNSVTSGGDGTICVDHLPFGTYSVTETAPPTGYKIDDTSAHNVPVNLTSTCGDGNEATFSATDTPLWDLQVRFRDGGSGATSGTISCESPTGTVLTADTTATTGWGASPPPTGTTNTYLGLTAPRTVTCTIEIDP
jgi:Prealbumin-like fold domain